MVKCSAFEYREMREIARALKGNSNTPGMPREVRRAVIEDYFRYNPSRHPPAKIIFLSLLSYSLIDSASRLAEDYSPQVFITGMFAAGAVAGYQMCRFGNKWGKALETIAKASVPRVRGF